MLNPPQANMTRVGGFDLLPLAFLVRADRTAGEELSLLTLLAECEVQLWNRVVSKGRFTLIVPEMARRSGRGRPQVSCNDAVCGHYRSPSWPARRREYGPVSATGPGRSA
jgi:hypothetical protein